MRHILLLVGLLFSLLSPAAAQQPEFWTQQGDRVRFGPADITLPKSAGAVRFKETREFSRKGEGLDTSVQYESPDGKIFATVYVYLPGVAHPGLAALATAEGVKANSQTPVTVHPSRVVAAGGAEGIAIRTDFDNYQGENRSGAAFIKADRWLIKLRVTGPKARAQEVDAIVAALLDGLRFQGTVEPAPAAVVEAAPCPAEPLPDAMPVADTQEDITGNAMMLAALDPAGQRPEGKQAGARDVLLSRFGNGWCRGVADTGRARVTFLRATGAGAPGNPGAESALVVLYSDAGGMLEVVRRRSEEDFVLLNHGIAVTDVLGMVDKVPSDAQIVRYLSGAEDAVLRTRATINLAPNGDTEIRLPTPQKVPPTT